MKSLIRSVILVFACLLVQNDAIGQVLNKVIGGDTRIALVDPCIFRIRLTAVNDTLPSDTAFFIGTGFMISDNWMLSAGHNFVPAGYSVIFPILVERNVPVIGLVTGASVPKDRFFILAAGDIKKENAGAGRDWAVVKVANNLGTGKSPGAGCKPTFDCSYDSTENKNLRVGGFGDDNFPPGVPLSLQTAVGKSLPMSPLNSIKHDVDTEEGSSGSPIFDIDSMKIIGIHVGGVKFKWENIGTAIGTPRLLKAILDSCGDTICPTVFPTSYSCCELSSGVYMENILEGDCLGLGGIWSNSILGNCSDVDNDGIVDGIDNCPNTYNPDQANDDLDNFGNLCDVTAPIPTLSQWGLILLTLLLLTIGIVAIPHKHSLALSTVGSGSLSPKPKRFDARLYMKMTMYALPIAVAFFALFSYLEGGIFWRNILGVVGSGALLVYLVHYWLLMNNPDH